MCGFAGIINLDGLERNKTLENRMNKALLRLHLRGPNQKGYWIDDHSYIVHSRLSIIDLSDAGKQPMERYGKVLVYNGEIYNYRELRDKLISFGYKFNSNSDTEVLIAGWNHWGEDVLKYINGMYSFIIWDYKNRRLFLARDPYGKKPLIYSIKNNSIAFASDLKSLEEIVDCGEINPIAVESLFKLRFIYDPLTIYKDAHKLKPGHIMHFNKDGHNIKQWYKLPISKNIIDSEKIIYQNITELFDNAVKRRLISDVPLGVLLSGGLDSSLIIASLAEQNRSLPCFTMGFKGASEYYEERPEASKLANYFGFKHHSIEISAKKTLSKIPEIFEASDEPFADTSALPLYMLLDEVSDEITVAISGDGGDEIFGGYRKYIGEKWNSLGLFIPKGIRKYISNFLPETKDSTYGEIARRIRKYLMNVSIEGSERQAGWLEQTTEETIKLLLGNNFYKTKNLLNEYRKGISDPINSMLAADLGLSLPGDMLVKLDRMSMANSLEVRSPFLDKELVEYAFLIPGNKKVGFLKGKKILRKVFKKRIPEWSMKLPKKGFEIPIENWLKTDLKSMLEDASASKNLKKLGINDLVISTWKEEFFCGKRDNSWQLWTLIAFKQWASSKGLL